MSTKYQVIDKHSGLALTDSEILDEANRDHTSEFSDYTFEDLETSPEDVLDWIDPQYFDIKLEA
jgi:hypothetical protein